MLLKRFFKFSLYSISITLGLCIFLGIVLIFSHNLQERLILSVSEYDVRIEKDIEYGEHARNKLNIYYPAQGDQGGPIVVFYYGGGWRGGRRNIYHFVGTALAKRGITTIIPDYRLYPDVTFPRFVEDAASSYSWVWQYFVKGKSKRPIILIGHSAGAHIAALLSFNSDYIKKYSGEIALPKGFVGLAGPYAFDPTTWPTTRDIFKSATSADNARPVSFVTGNSPKTLLFHGLDDQTVKLWNAETLADKLSKANVENNLIKLNGIGHIGLVLTLAKPFRWRAPVLNEIENFIKSFDQQ